MLDDQEAVVAFCQDGYGREEGVGAEHIQRGDVSVHLAGSAGADEGDLVALQFRLAVDGSGQDLAGSDQEAEGIQGQGGGGVEFDFHGGE